MLNRIALCAAVLSAVPLAAQRSGPEDVQLRNDCRLAEQVVRTGEPAPHRGWAYSFITRCPESGPATLVSRWQDTNTDERTLQRLVIASSRLATREVFEAVSNAARNSQSTPVVRIYALSMLYGFAHPGRSVSVQDLLQGRESLRVRVYRVSGDGDRPNLVGDVTAQVEALLSEIIASGGEPSVVRAAMTIRQLP
jgi:hypothetical protein